MKSNSYIHAFCSLVILMSFNVNADGHESKIIDNITIIGEKELPGSADIVSSEDLEKFETIDVHKALAIVPGINVRPEEGYGLRPNISIRGTYPDRSGKVTLMEDGILIAPAPYAASSAYYFPTFSRINSVEVVKGPAAITTGPYQTQYRHRYVQFHQNHLFDAEALRLRIQNFQLNYHSENVLSYCHQNQILDLPFLRLH